MTNVDIPAQCECSCHIQAVAHHDCACITARWNDMLESIRKRDAYNQERSVKVWNDWGPVC